MGETCTHWHLVSTGEVMDTYAHSETVPFDPDECPTVQVTHGHRVVCDDCRKLSEAELIRQAVKNVATDTAAQMVAAVSHAAEGVTADIVRALARRDPALDVGGYDDSSWVCSLCPDDWDVDEWRERHEDIIHHDDCAWRRAKAWVEANPEAT